jgi:hypothetical protein
MKNIIDGITSSSGLFLTKYSSRTTGIARSPKRNISGLRKTCDRYEVALWRAATL